MTQPDMDLRRAWRRRIKQAEAELDSDDFASAHAHARIAADLAQNLGVIGPLKRTGAILQKLSDWEGHARMAARIDRLREPGGPPEWDGSHVRSLVVTERNKEHIGRPIRFARFLPQAAERVDKCIVLAEPRLIALFRRSFPGIDIRPLDQAGDAIASADAVAGYQTLITLFGRSDEEIHASFRPLVSDKTRVQELRNKYLPGPVIGISWGSTNARKALPALTEWIDTLSSIRATYVSLQYGDVGGDIAEFAKAGANIVHDDSVDAFGDIDGLAAQISAMDAVVSVSNTTVHLAGALGAATYVVVEVDRNLSLIWPLVGDTVPWYPSVSLIRKDGASWQQSMARLREALRQKFPDSAGSR